MTDSTITVEEFQTRLLAICSGGGGSGMPRRDRDVAVILASMTLWMDPDALYSEAEITDGLARWLTEVCPRLGLDPVTLRRELIDRNYLTRDDTGTHYAPGPGPVEWGFEDGVGGLDPAGIVAAAADERARRKAAWTSRGAGGSP